MSAKSFCYTSAGIFLLVAAYTLGARHARADFEPTSGSHVIGASFSGGFYALRSDGTIWLDGAQQVYIPPMPDSVLSNVIFYEGLNVVTRDGYRWVGGEQGWTRAQQIPPPAPLSTQGKTWSGVKEGYRRK